MAMRYRSLVVGLDPGHGAGAAHNRGGVCYNEGDNNFYYALVLKREFLKIPGVRVVMTRNKVTDNPSLTQRGNMMVGVDLMLSLHSDAFHKSSVNGTTIYDSVRKPNRELATKLVNGISSMFNSLDRGVKFKEGQTGWDWYGVLRASKAKSSMIIEHGFHTNVRDCAYFKNNHTAIAKKTVQIVKVHYGLGGSKPNEGGSEMAGNVSYYSRNKNNSGYGVMELQKNLVALGYSVGSMGPDGIFGVRTETAVKRYQKANGLVQDGMAGPATLAKITSQLKAKPSTSSTAEAKLAQIKKIVNS